MTKPTTLCIVAGGSGGHILPALTLAQMHSPQHVLFFSSTKAIDSTIAPHVTRIPLALPPMPGKKLWRYPGYFLSFARCTWQAWQHLRATRPSKIISTGGQLGIPVCLAGKLLGIPIEVYELNARPGRAMRVLGKLATRVCYVFDECGKYLPKAEKVAYPVRFSGGAKQDPHNTLLILGGSQGSAEVNQLVKNWITPSEFSIIHQVGAREDMDAWQRFYAERKIPAEVFTYRHDLQECYERATHAIARAGAGTIFELAHFGIPTVLVPLAGAQSHQVHNAQAIARQNELFSVCGPQPTQKQFNESLAHLFRDRKSH